MPYKESSFGMSVVVESIDARDNHGVNLMIVVMDLTKDQQSRLIEVLKLEANEFILNALKEATNAQAGRLEVLHAYNRKPDPK